VDHKKNNLHAHFRNGGRAQTKEAAGTPVMEPQSSADATPSDIERDVADKNARTPVRVTRVTQSDATKNANG
tara:strand:+ start:829 stop:1044 length:216 start_codon:yes stop_codon:yes gene_type:complete